MLGIDGKITSLPITSSGDKVDGFVGGLTILPCADTLPSEGGSNNQDQAEFYWGNFHWFV